MSIKIAPRPLPSTPAASSLTGPSAPASSSAGAAPQRDSFSSAATGSSSSITLGPREPCPNSAAEISAMGIDQLNAIKPEQVLGMTTEQYKAFSKATGEAGGFDKLDPAVRKAAVRKQIMRGLVEMFKEMAHKYDIPG